MSNVRNITSVMNDDQRRAYAQNAINKTMRKFVLYHVGVSVAVAVVVHVINKKLAKTN